MRRLRRLLWGGAAAAVAGITVLTVGGSAATGTQAPETVETAEGPVRGTVTDGHRSFQGIPYAAPPVGERRWRPPQPVKTWEEPRDATRPRASCPQLEGDQAGVPSKDEDCLYLNVTAPAGADKENLPVIVFVHGGGIYGAGSQYDPARMAARGDAVVVTVNYRLGAFGFLSHPGLDDGGTANLGLADQQAALAWAKDNAAAFGGDAGNITLMGESSGGFSACANLTSPAAKGLFDKAILESAPCGNMKGIPRAQADKQGQKLAAKLGCEGQHVAACLREVPVSDVLEAYGRQPTAELITDDPLLPTAPSQALADGAFHRVPVLHGVNRDEQRLLIGGAEALGGEPITRKQYPGLLKKSFKENAAEVEKEYPLSDYGSPSEALAAAQTDHEYATGLLDTSAAFSRHVPTYTFEFADPKAPWFAGYDKPSFPTGAFHMAELNYLFAAEVFDGKDAAQRGLGDQMIDYWTTFARDGEPTGGGLPGWQPYNGSYVQALAPGHTGRTDFGTAHKYAFWKHLEG
ncbi:carboxylesterase/lipase family protein [Streptomyces reniochalinae]|uniref:Carboxylic ester hydrolase n=1 Tax=Streptomyces reniochalinae TaxID=2250578 RepID=A0A367EBI0_9ACTN|nr:carboxylesterase family protein [Streptomyces reniochalinae]RCG15414.1 carboxylesterase family protein [Streptomyces reniochalinae]